MTFAYHAFFTSIWLANVLAIPTVLVMLIGGLAWYAEPTRLAIGLSIATVGLLCCTRL